MYHHVFDRGEPFYPIEKAEIFKVKFLFIDSIILNAVNKKEFFMIISNRY